MGKKKNLIVVNLGFVNAYLLKIKSDYILIDTGVSFQKQSLEKQLKDAGCTEGKLKLIIITHGDMDHFGNAGYLQEKYGAKIAIHRKDYEILKSGIMPKRKMGGFLRKKMFELFYHIWKLTHKELGFKPDIFLEDGDNLKKFNLNAKILHVPGHTKGSIAILFEDNLFSGDTLLNIKKPRVGHIVENEKELENSVKKIRKLKVKMVYPGHGKPFEMKQLFKQEII